MATRFPRTMRRVRPGIALLVGVMLIASCASESSDTTTTAPAAVTTTTAAETTAPPETTVPEEVPVTELTGAELEAAAQAEGGQLLWYNSGNPDLVASVVAGFQAAYPFMTVEGVPVNFTELPAKVATEHVTNAPTADVVWMPPTLRQGMQEIGALAPISLEGDANMPADTLDPDEFAHPVWQLAIGLVFDPTITTDIPSDPLELADPVWMDRIAFDRVANLGQSATWLSVWRQAMGDPAWDEWLDGVAANNIFITANARSAYEAVVTQEREIAIASSNYIQFQDPALTVEMSFDINPVPFYNHQYILARAAHPASAKLFMEWASTAEGQAAIADVGLSPIMDIEHDNSMSSFLAGASLVPGTDLVDFSTRTDEYLESLTARWPG